MTETGDTGIIQRERAGSGPHAMIITIARTAQTFLVTVEHAATGAIVDEHTRAWETKEQARAMARNAYRWYAGRENLTTFA